MSSYIFKIKQISKVLTPRARLTTIINITLTSIGFICKKNNKHYTVEFETKHNDNYIKLVRIRDDKDYDYTITLTKDNYNIKEILDHIAVINNIRISNYTAITNIDIEDTAVNEYVYEALGYFMPYKFFEDVEYVEKRNI